MTTKEKKILEEKKIPEDFIRANFDQMLSILGGYALEVDAQLKISEKYRTDEEMEVFRHGQTHGIASTMLYLSSFMSGDDLDFETLKKEIREAAKADSKESK